jgi:hypothetical protein
LIPVVRLAPGNQWDQCLLDDLISGALWPHGLEFERLDAYPSEADGILLVCPGRYYADHTAEISAAIARYRWVLAFRVGDEEDVFDINRVVHPNIRWFVQTPRVGKDYGTARFLPLGYPPHFRDLPAEAPDRSVDMFLSAQNTHARRAEAFRVLARGEHVQRVTATEGFTHGVRPAEYTRQMCMTKVAPAPSGAVSPDSFRLWEALEAHCVPIADDISPVQPHEGYWRMLLGDPPFPVLTDYRNLPGWIADLLADWPRNANRIAAWWIQKKRSLAIALREDLQSLGAL